MIDLLDDITEIPFKVFIDKWDELKPSIYNRDKAEMIWFYMKEPDRIEAFKALCRNHPMIQICREPYLFLRHFDMP